MNEEEIREYIRAKNNPVSNCVGLSQYFIGRHKVLPVYLTPEFEIEFNNKMCESEKLKEQLEKEKEVKSKAIGHVNACGGELTKDQCKYLLQILDIYKGE